MSDSVTYRVVKLPESLLTGVRKKRDQDETANASFVAAAVLGQLKEGAETINLPATRLLELCLVAAVQPRETPKRRRRRRPKSDEAARPNSKRPR